jgi:hypothetical protein
MPGGASALEATVHGVRIAVSGLPRSDEELRGWMGRNVGFELPL